MASLREAFTQLGVFPERGVHAGFQTHPASLRELLRVAALPALDLNTVWPNDPSPFYSFDEDEAQGIVYAGEIAGAYRWFLSSKDRVFRVAIAGPDPFHPSELARELDVGLDQMLDQASLDPQNDHAYDHLGDLGHADGVLFAPVKSNHPPHVIVGLSEDLRVVAWAELSESSADSLCAVHPWNGLLYVMGNDPHSDELQAYDISAFLHRRDRPGEWGRQVPMPRHDDAMIRLTTPTGDPDGHGGQGLAFSANGRIYLTRSHAAVRTWNDRIVSWSNKLYVYSALTGRRFGDGREWDFRGWGDEIEGVSLHPEGAIYIVVNDNDWDGTDTLYLYTLRFAGPLPSNAV